MKKLLYTIFLTIIICNSQTKQPYETTWLESTVTDSIYVPYNYPNWHTATKSPMKITVKKDSLIWANYLNGSEVYKIDSITYKGGSYLFHLESDNNFKIKFEWFDKKKHVARWTIYYGLIYSYLYIDSLYASQNSNLSSKNAEEVNVVVNFLNWYKDNYETVNSFNLVETNFHSDPPKPYTVNLSQCEEYLNALKKSGYISDQYIEKWRKYFILNAENLKKNPQTDGPADGFEFDFVLLTQDNDLEAIPNLKITEFIKTDKDRSEIVIAAPPSGLLPLRFSLSKRNTKWLIDDIDIKAELNFNTTYQP